MGKKRHRTSKYDDFRDQIVEWYGQGMPMSEMVERLGEGFYEQGIYTFIRTRGIKERSKQMVYDKRPCCKNCEYCHEYINTNNGKGRICSNSWRTIQPNVIYSPTWCEKR